MSHILYLSTATIQVVGVCFAPFHDICFYWCHPCSNAVKRFPSIEIKEVATRANLGKGEVLKWFNLHCSKEAIFIFSVVLAPWSAPVVPVLGDYWYYWFCCQLIRALLVLLMLLSAAENTMVLLVLLSAAESTTGTAGSTGTTGAVVSC
jgi:hypothetical protein